MSTVETYNQDNRFYNKKKHSGYLEKVQEVTGESPVVGSKDVWKLKIRHCKEVRNVKIIF